MIKINDELLQELGLGGLPPAEKDSLLKHIYETLEMRVGMRLADQMSNEQLDEFEQYFEAKDDAGAFKWLETNFPNYKDIVQQEFDKLKTEVGQATPQILNASQGAVPAAAAPAPAAPAPQIPATPQGPPPQAQQSPQPQYQSQPQAQPQPQPVQPWAPSPQSVPQPPMSPAPDPMSAPQPQPMQPPAPQQWTPPVTDTPSQQPPAGPQAWPPQAPAA